MVKSQKNSELEISELNSNQELPLEVTLENTLQELDLAKIELQKVNEEIEFKKKELKLEQRRDISDEEKQIINKQVGVINKRQSESELIRKQKEYDNQKVTGKFINRRNPGQMAKLTYFKYEDDPVKWYPFQDGKVYTIPRGFADQINEHYHTPVFIQKAQEQMVFSDNVGENSTIAEVDRSNKKYAFVPVNF